MNTLLEAPDQTGEQFYDHAEEKPARILVADDDVDIRHLVIEALTVTGYEVDDAENGARAWKALHLKSYDLLITDHEMPELNGLQLVKKLRAAGFELPIIFASGSLLPEFMAQSSRLTSVTVVAKPFTLDELRRTVGRLLPSHKAPWVRREAVSSHGVSKGNYS